MCQRMTLFSGGHITEPANTTTILKTRIKNLVICKNTVSLIDILQLSVLQLRNQSMKQICYWLWKYTREDHLLTFCPNNDE
jgi:hypothetical protein